MKDDRLNPQQPVPGNRKAGNDAYRPAKRLWQKPELMEADYVATENGIFEISDGFSFS